MNLTILCQALSLALSATATQPDARDARSAHDHTAHPDLEAVVVTATPLREDSESVLAPVAVLSGSALDDARAQSLGETVGALAGVTTSTFGAAVGRPIIRGQEGVRVSVLNDGLTTGDVSTVSVDHAVGIEPFLADQIEVLKGPATLLYGSGAIGGVVNVVDGRVPTRVPDGIEGRFETAFDSVADTRMGALRLDAGHNGWAVHADAAWREADDYEVPGSAYADPEEADEHPLGVVENTALRTRSGALGFSRVGEWGHAGVAFSSYRSEYGIPGHEHEHEEEERVLAGGGAKSLDFEGVYIDLKQERVVLDTALTAPFAGAEQLRFKLSRTNYEHQEIEPDGEVGTDFDNDETDARLEWVHTPWGPLTGAIGVTWNDRDFSALGEEAFVPPSRTRSSGVFVVEQSTWGDWRGEFGARLDRNRVQPEAGESRRFSLFSASASLRRSLGEHWQIGVLADRAQRAPVAEELYADGAHLATGLFEIGNPDLGRETANQIELEVRYEGARVHWHASAFLNRYDDYLFLVPAHDDHEEHAGTGLLDDDHEHEDELPVVAWTQQDARFHGLELGGHVDLSEGPSGQWTLDFMADRVRARTDDPIVCEDCEPSTALARIAPARIGLGLGWSRDAWRARLGAIHTFAPDNPAEAASADSEYTLVDATVAWTLPWERADSEVYLQVRNLTDEAARPQVSFLKDVAPLPGRNWILGLRMTF